VKERNSIKEVGVEGRMILKWILKSVEERGLDSSGSGLEEVAGCC
jgi:hypothetical protein